MKIAIAGHRGFIGSKLLESMHGHEWILLERDELYGDTELLAGRIEGVDVLMNFAGYPVSRRWTKKNRERIRKSRIDVTRNLVAAVERTSHPPAHLLFASAIGIYATGREHSEESRNFGSGFLAVVVRDWEAAMKSTMTEGRLTIIRIGLVLGNTGGAFPLLRALFNFFLGGIMGSGKQGYSFIHIDDLSGMVKYCIERKITGIVNATAPHPVDNREFSRTLARVMKRPMLFRVPGWALRLMRGKASSIILEGQKVYPERIQKEGYRFMYPEVETALRNLVGKR